jgi:uncharacterized membrane protein YfcA
LPSNRPQANRRTLIARRDRADLVAERRGRIQERQVAYDVRAPRPVAEALHAAIPNSELVLLPEVGHVCNLEAPEAFNAEMRRFLRTAQPVACRADVQKPENPQHHLAKAAPTTLAPSASEHDRHGAAAVWAAHCARRGSHLTSYDDSARIGSVSLPVALFAFCAGLLVAVLTAPVGVSGAVFLLPIQLDLLRVPSPAVTPTNLLFNVVATPGALLRYKRTGRLGGTLPRQLLTGTLPGVVIGTLVRVYLAPGDRIFRLLAAGVLLPLGLWLCLRRRDRPVHPRTLSTSTITGLGFAVGIIGGIYGIGGGSLLGPILVSAGMSVAVVAPAALTATFLTSIAGVTTYGLLSLTTTGPVSPHWAIGALCGLGGLIGGYLGARLQPRMPETGLRILLGVLAVGLALTYIAQAVSR